MVEVLEISERLDNLKVGQCLLEYRRIAKNEIVFNLYFRCRNCNRIESENFLIERKSALAYLTFIKGHYKIENFNINDIIKEFD